jgi:hypothetical protein
MILGADSKRRLSVVDPRNRELLLSIGAFTENLVTAAGAMGYVVETEVIGKSPFDQDLVRLNIHKGKPTGYPLKRIEKRRTVKKGLTNRELRSADITTFSTATEKHLFYFQRETTHANCIRDGAVECFRIQTMNDNAQKELAKWIRFRDREAREHRDGLTTDGMEISGFGGWYVRNFMDEQDVLGEKFRTQGIEVTAELANEGAGWLILSSEGDAVADLIETGRRFERMALLARERGIGIHPMTQMLEEETGRRMIAENHPKGIIPQFILRVGYIDPYPDPVSLRRPVISFVKR